MNSSRNTKLTLYKKEQLMLCILLFCFVLSRFCLPIVKEKLAPPPDSLEQLIVINDSDEVKEPIDAEVVVEATDDVVEEVVVEVVEDVEDVETEVTVPEPEQNETPKDNKPSKQPETSVPSPKPETQTPCIPEKEQEPEKIWVPPVYEIVHHEAVYETVRVIICNYCSEEFSSVGEFQVHKDANGG